MSWPQCGSASSSCRRLDTACRRSSSCTWIPSAPAWQRTRGRQSKRWQAEQHARPSTQMRLSAAAERAEGQQKSLEAALAVVQDFCIEHEVPQGRLVVRPEQEDDVGAASVVLTRAFATSAQAVPIGDGRSYCLDCLSQPPRGVLLVARLHPVDEKLLPPGQSSRVVATTGLSFCRDTREEFPSLQPPDDAVYLSNMAVDPKQRRQGYARLMLAASEAMSAALGFSCVYLHARLGDTPAQQLYLSSGYAVVEQDSWVFAKLRNITPRALMRKNL